MRAPEVKALENKRVAVFNWNVSNLLPVKPKTLPQPDHYAGTSIKFQKWTEGNYKLKIEKKLRTF